MVKLMEIKIQVHSMEMEMVMVTETKPHIMQLLTIMGYTTEIIITLIMQVTSMEITTLDH